MWAAGLVTSLGTVRLPKPATPASWQLAQPDAMPAWFMLQAVEKSPLPVRPGAWQDSQAAAVGMWPGGCGFVTTPG